MLNSSSPAAVFDEQLKFSEIDAVILDGHIQKFNSNPNDVDTRFEYALALSRSNDVNNKRIAIRHFYSLSCCEKYSKDAIYYLAVQHYQLKEYERARTYVEGLYKANPDSPQIKNLFAAVTQRHNEDRKRKEKESADFNTGAAVIGAAAALIGGIFLMKKK